MVVKGELMGYVSVDEIHVVLLLVSAGIVVGDHLVWNIDDKEAPMIVFDVNGEEYKIELEDVFFVLPQGGG